MVAEVSGGLILRTQVQGNEDSESSESSSLYMCTAKV